MLTTYLTLTMYQTPSSLSVCELPLAVTPSAPFLNLQVHERFLCRMVPHSLVVLMMADDESFIVHPLIATSPSAMWHLPGTRSLAGAGDVVLQGCLCHTVVMGGARWVLWMVMVVIY